MPETIQLFRVLLAAPSDVTEEHALVAEAINDWNLQHGDGARARVELMNWRTHAHPATGRRPQALINRQFADRADVVLAIFWRRLGSPTGKASSGTVEEIERAQRRGKKVMVYFSQRPSTEKEPPIRANKPEWSRSDGDWGGTPYMGLMATCGNSRPL
jgi:hypothetical protein